VIKGIGGRGTESKSLQIIKRGSRENITTTGGTQTLPEESGRNLIIFCGPNGGPFEMIIRNVIKLIMFK
jgi:hypothetical protein